MNKKKLVLGLILLVTLFVVGIGIHLYMNSESTLESESEEVIGSTSISATTTEVTTIGEVTMTYKSITMEEARLIFEEPGDYIILDVRRPDEFSQGHIPGAINIPNEDIGTDEISELPDKNQVIYVYCRSGNRSKLASEKLVAMGYMNIIEFGGILDWTGEIEE